MGGGRLVNKVVIIIFFNLFAFFSFLSMFFVIPRIPVSFQYSGTPCFANSFKYTLITVTKTFAVSISSTVF